MQNQMPDPKGDHYDKVPPIRYQVDCGQDDLISAVILPSFVETDMPMLPGGCLFNISTNMHMPEPTYPLLPYAALDGNFVDWIDVKRGQSIAVTGMAGCASIFVANHDFSKMAAGHISGGPQYLEQWCQQVLKQGDTVPVFMVFSISEETCNQQDIISNYINALGTSHNLVVKHCGAISIERLDGGTATVYARYSTSFDSASNPKPPSKLTSSYAIQTDRSQIEP